jgi:hypothetical protein
MSYETETAGRYRNRATQLRSMPTTYEDRDIASAMARVAQDYDLMARVFDDIDQASLASFRAKNSN